MCVRILKLLLVIAIVKFLAANCQTLKGKRVVCHGNIYIHNAPKNLEKIQNCTVIDGNLYVVLMSKYHGVSKPFKDYTNNNLREVTGHVIFYQLVGLQSLGELFPNLTIIRGRELFRGYALVIFDLHNLQEVGLYSLVKIEHGGVVLVKIPRVCFIDATIDWRSIANADEDYLMRPSLSCPEACKRCLPRNCWNEDVCQPFITGPAAPVCHKQCLTCDVNNSSLCLTCKHYTYNDVCVETCPGHTVICNSSMICIDPSECDTYYAYSTGWVWNGYCIDKCPSSYRQVALDGHKTCEPCEQCENVCNSTTIHTIMDLEETEGCEIIDGYLEIHLENRRGSMSDLEKYLGRIREIKEYLLVKNSNRITSLSFLKNLRRIGGEEQILGGHSFLIHDMPAIREIFPDNYAENITIAKGNITIYNNDLLCPKEVFKFYRQVKAGKNSLSYVPEPRHFDIRCSDVLINLTVISVDTHSAKISFVSDIKGVMSSTLNFVLYFAQVGYEDDVENKVVYCSKYNWNTVQIQSKQETIVTYVLNDLFPATAYAMYLDFSITDDVPKPISARSKTVKVLTPADRPPSPHITDLMATSPYSFVVKWIDHNRYERAITRYVMDIYVLSHEFNEYLLKDYCAGEVVLMNETERHSRSFVINPNKQRDACTTFCAEYSENRFVDIKYEDIFDICDGDSSICDDGSSEDHQSVPNATINGKFISFRVELPSTVKYYEATKLQHFTEYQLKLKACKGPKEDDCGRTVRDFIRTRPLLNADLIDTLEVFIINDILYMFWDSPIHPNGLVLAYIVKVRQENEFNNYGLHVPKVTCISLLEHEKNGRAHYEPIGKDKYLSFYVSICTVSLAGETCTEYIKIDRNRSVVGLVVGFLVSILIIFVLFYSEIKQYLRKGELFFDNSGDKEALVENIEMQETSRSNDFDGTSTDELDDDYLRNASELCNTESSEFSDSNMSDITLEP